MELASNDSLIFSEGLQQNISAINDKISVDETKINNFKERANEQSLDSEGDDESNQIALVNRWKYCYKCGDKNWHKRSNCKARDSLCKNCNKRGNF